MKKIIELLKNSLEISKNEAQGLLILSGIILASLIITMFYTNYKSTTTSELIIKEYGNTQFPKEKNSNFSTSKFKYAEYSNNRSFSKNYSTKSYLRFKFDPNLASQPELESLGIPKYICNIILNYRNKGGKFKFKEDLLRIYAMKPEIYERLEALIVLPSRTENTNKSYDEISVIESSAKEIEKTPPLKKISIEKFDINTADTIKLIALKGIGSIFAKRIIKYRDVLGGFYTLNQIEETYGLTPEAVAEIKKYAIISSGYKKIRINQDKIAKHPYFSYSQIKGIENYKNQHGTIKNIDEFRNLKIIDEATLEKARPYLDFN